jgi:flagellar hook-associated protein 3 FlgL
MRISTNTLFESGATRIGSLQTSLNRTQEQMASGRRILTPSDDPVAAAQALDVSQSQSINEQLTVNRGNARNSLSVEESTLGNVTTLLQDVKTAIIEAGNGSLDNQQRGFIAAELQGRLDDLFGLANAVDGAGNQIFAGYQTTKTPFIKTATGGQYNGDEGERVLQVGPRRQIAVSDAGSAVFERNKTGNGVFVANPAPGNAGSGVVTTGSVVDSTALTGHEYTISFTSAGTYDIVDATAGTAVSTGNAYVSGQSISFDGMQLSIEGTPGASDQFSVKPSSSQSIFTALTDLVNILKTPVTNDADGARLKNGLRASHNVVTSALDNVMTVRASVGSRLKELDSLDEQGEDRKAQLAENMMNLQEIDYTEAVTKLSKEKMMLEAVQQSFALTSGLSLFNYIS